MAEVQEMGLQETSFDEVLMRNEQETRMADLSIRTKWNLEHQEGCLEIRVIIQGGQTGPLERLFVRAVIHASDGSVLTVGGSRWITVVPSLAPKTPCEVHLSRAISRTLSSSVAHSRDHHLLLILEDHRGCVLDAVSGRLDLSDLASTDIRVQDIHQTNTPILARKQYSR